MSEFITFALFSLVTGLLGLSEQFVSAAGEGARQMLSVVVTLLPIVGVLSFV